MGSGAFLAWEEVEDLVRRFEAQTLLGEHDWTHRDHLATAAYYCIGNPASAEEKMRRGIQALNAARGVAQTPEGGYHETLTVAWTRLISAHVASSTDTPLEQVNSVLTHFEDRKAVLAYYSRDRIMSQEARYGWVAPDLEPLP